MEPARRWRTRDEEGADPSNPLCHRLLDGVSPRAGDRHGAREVVQKLSKRTSRDGIVTTLLVRNGDPAEQIVRAGRAGKVDLIVVGTHGRRGLKKLFLYASRIAA